MATNVGRDNPLSEPLPVVLVCYRRSILLGNIRGVSSFYHLIVQKKKRQIDETVIH